MKTIFIILGNQLFPYKHIQDYKSCQFYMAEDYGLCTYVKHHKKKIVLFLTAMRDYCEQIKTEGFKIEYKRLAQDKLSYEERLIQNFPDLKKIISFEVEDKFFESRLKIFCEEHGIEWEIIPSPMFLCSRQKFELYLKEQKKPFMKTFYQQQRKELNILLDNNKPEGGQWSFDEDNRKKMPKNISLPEPFPKIEESKHLNKVIDIVNKEFPNHPGTTDNFEYGTSQKHYELFIDYFLKLKLERFGQYQDSITSQGDFLFHSVVSPGMNIGLITPDSLIQKVLKFYKKNDSPLNSVEGFIRQVMGWREFIRGIYQNYSEEQDKKNFWGHKKKLNQCWYEGTTGVPVIDDAIKKAHRTGYNHHIERLMIIGNMMLLCEIEPKQAHQWFMEMFVDSSDWVMGPNVYGMALFSDGGIFATKPYICGSNYWLKMSDYKKGDWCDAVDGLYWRFINKHQDYFSKNPRLSMMARMLDKMKKERKEKIFTAAEKFLKKVTV